MNIAIKKFGAGQPETLTAFAEHHQLTLVVRERARGSLARYYASFPNVEVVSERGGLIGEYGDGNTPEEATKAYARRLAGRCIVIGAYTPERFECNVPNDFHHEPDIVEGP